MINFAPHSTESSSTNSLQADPSVAKFEFERHPPCIFVGTTQGLYILNSEQRLEREDNSITALALSTESNSDNIEETKLWVIVDHKSVWYRSFEGEWFPVGSGYNRRLNCILPIDGTILVGTSEAHLMQIRDGNIRNLSSFDQVKGRKAWYTPWGSPPDVRSLAISSSGDLYVNVHVGGILRSRDQGQSWEPTLDLHADVHEVRTIAESPNLVLAATAEGLAWSEDYGESWQFDRANLHTTYARAIALCSHNEQATILMSVSLGPHGNQAALYRRSLNQPGTFEKCQQGLPEWFSNNIDTSCLATWGNWAVFGTQTGQIFRSNNAGLTWEQIASDLAPIHCLSLTFAMV
jgi:hypothetical protein